MGGTSSTPTDEAAARVTPTDQRELPVNNVQPPTECPMHASNVETKQSPPSGCPMHAGKENDIDPTNMVCMAF